MICPDCNGCENEYDLNHFGKIENDPDNIERTVVIKCQTCGCEGEI